MALPTNTGAFIHNGVNCTPNTIQTAQGVPYDNTSSGLSATNVQGAINEVYTCCIPLVYGTQTATTSNWTGELNVSTLYDGLTITYYLPYDSDGNVSLNLTLADGSTTGSKPVYLQIGKRLSTQFSAGATILITYYSAGSISKSGTPTDADIWVCNAESMQVQQVYLPNPPDAPYPVLFGVGLSVGNIFGPTVKDIYNLNYNPQTTTLTATKFSGDISGCTGLSGASVSYSNTSSGLSATTVQGAVDEVYEYTKSDGLHTITLESGFTCAEYMNYLKLGRMVVVNIGGITHNAATAGATVCNGLPVMRSRGLCVVANDTTTNKVTVVYGAIGNGYLRLSAHEANVRYYGQMIYLTD